MSSVIVRVASPAIPDSREGERGKEEREGRFTLVHSWRGTVSHDGEAEGT